MAVKGAKKAQAVAVPLTPGNLPPGVPVIQAHAGDTLVVDVDVENIVVYYTVVFDERTLMYSLVDRREKVQGLTAGIHRLSWSFSHVEQEWKHEISAQVNEGPVQVLESKSEANKDSPYSLGLALVMVS